MTCALNCLFVVNILQFVLSKLIPYLNFMKQKESLLGEKLRCAPQVLPFFLPSI